MEPAAGRTAFRANNELALHVPDPEAAAAFYADVLGCQVARREPDCIEVVSGVKANQKSWTRLRSASGGLSGNWPAQLTLQRLTDAHIGARLSTHLVDIADPAAVSVAAMDLVMRLAPAAVLALLRRWQHRIPFLSRV